MCPPGSRVEPQTPDAKPYALSERRAELLIHIGELQERADDDPSAVEAQAAVVIASARKANDPELLALSLRVMSMAKRALWDERAGRRLLDEAVRVTRKHDLPHVEAVVLASRATAHHELGNALGAARDLDAALVAMGRATAVDPVERARFFGRVGISLAVVEQHSGRLFESEQRYRALLRAGDLDARMEAMASNNLAYVLADQGRYDDALRAADDAVARATEQVPSLLAHTLQNRAWIEVRAGRLQQGMRDFDRSEAAFIAAGSPTGEFYAEYADAMTDLRLLPEATVAATRAVEELAQAGHQLVLMEAQVRLARIMLLTGRPHDAGALAELAAAEARRQRRTVWKDRALLLGVEARLAAGDAGSEDLGVARRAATRLERSGELHSAVEGYLVAGRVALGIDDTRAAAPPLARARELARRGQVLLRLRGRLAGALAERAGHRDGAALAECRAGLRDLSIHRSALPTIELRALASGHGAELGEIGLGVVLSQGSPARALAWMERTRAAALLVRLPASDAALADREPWGTDDDGGAGRDRSVVADRRPVRAAADWSRAELSPVAEGVADRQVRVAAVREVLDGRTLVEFGKLEDRLVAVVVDARRTRIVEIGSVDAVEAELRPLLFALRRLANPRGAEAAAGARVSADLRIARLASLLVGPLGVDADDELVVVPVGLLHGVPWSCLHSGPLALAPSATFWARTARAAAGWPGGSGTVLVAGPDLDGARDEVEALRSLHRGSTVLAPDESRARDVVAAIAEADLAHLACHGTPRTDNPMFSSLLLADGPVTVQELHGAGVAPHRLVLASCHSGADVAYLGDEVLGFVSAMLAQGTAGVVASIAAVPDVAAVDLMLELHRGLREGQTMARALHAARARIDRGSPEGFVNWCTFSAHGAA